VDEAATRVLVIEDHEPLGRFITAALSGGGWVVTGPISSQAAAFDAVRRQRFAIAVMDCMLRGQEAFAIADAIVERGAGCLLISGHPRSTLPARLRDLPFLEKPFTMSALVTAVRAIEAGPR
jgi:DNA-binding response OmpR family regulator